MAMVYCPFCRKRFQASTSEDSESDRPRKKVSIDQHCPECRKTFDIRHVREMDKNRAAFKLGAFILLCLSLYFGDNRGDVIAGRKDHMIAIIFGVLAMIAWILGHRSFWKEKKKYKARITILGILLLLAIIGWTGAMGWLVFR